MLFFAFAIQLLVQRLQSDVLEKFSAVSRLWACFEFPRILCCSIFDVPRRILKIPRVGFIVNLLPIVNLGSVSIIFIYSYS